MARPARHTTETHRSDLSAGGDRGGLLALNSLRAHSCHLSGRMNQEEDRLLSQSNVSRPALQIVPGADGKCGRATVIAFS